MRQGIALLVVVSLMIWVFGCTGNSLEEPRINPSSFPDTNRFGPDNYRTFPYIVRTSPRIVIGEVIGVVEEGRKGMYRLQVNQCIDNKISGQTIIFSHQGQLNIGQDYLLFFRRLLSLEAYTFDFYVAWHGLTLAVDEDGTLWQLPNERTSSYAPPFATEQYNETDALLEYIASVRKYGPPPLHPIFEQLPLQYNLLILVFLWGNSILIMAFLVAGSIPMYRYFRANKVSKTGTKN